MARSSDYPFPISLFKDRTFQAREIRRVMKVSLIYLLATTVLLAVFYQQLLGQLLEGTAPLLFVSEDAALIDEAVPTLGAMLFKWVMAMLVINVLVTAAVGVYIARRLGHPLLALKRSLREIGAGNLDVQLRDSDTGEFAEITHELMTALATVQTACGCSQERRRRCPCS